VYPEIRKIKQIVQACYYWYKIDNNIEQFVYNCYVCRHSTVLWDKTSGLLYLLPVADCLWQHLSVDFKSFLKDCCSFDTIVVFVNRFRKQPISILCYCTVNALKLAWLYLIYIYKYYRPVTMIVSDHRLQFVSAFWDEFNQILRTKIKLLTAFYL
jgi:hypothetical protein